MNMTTTLFARSALLADGWAQDVLIAVDEHGWIIGIDADRPEPLPDGVDIIDGHVIPGMANVHSQAFQRAMAGMAERASLGKKDNFWGWRETMYRFLADLGPDEMHVIAAQVYVEMLKAGYTSVGEFHYVHHQPNGEPYKDTATLSESLIMAALETGIGITHMPVLYAYGGFGAKPATTGQARFLMTPDGIAGLVEKLKKNHAHNPQVKIGFAHHSLRAVSPDMFAEATRAVQALDPEIPIHIHAAGQLGEVEACLDWSGKRPVQWLLDNAKLDSRWTIVHATHMTEDETQRLAKSGAVVGLCPTSEANLGDGIFSLLPYLEAGGKIGIGSDSNISVSMIEELRWLEYVQRLVKHARTLVHSPEISSVGADIYEKASSGGALSLGRKTGKIELGCRADFVVLNAQTPAIIGKVRDHVLDAAIFAGNQNPVKDVMVGGRWAVKDGHHRREEQIFARYRKTIEGLM